MWLVPQWHHVVSVNSERCWSLITDFKSSIGRDWFGWHVFRQNVSICRNCGEFIPLLNGKYPKTSSLGFQKELYNFEQETVNWYLWVTLNWLSHIVIIEFVLALVVSEDIWMMYYLKHDVTDKSIYIKNKINFIFPCVIYISKPNILSSLSINKV